MKTNAATITVTVMLNDDDALPDDVVSAAFDAVEDLDFAGIVGDRVRDATGATPEVDVSIR